MESSYATNNTSSYTQYPTFPKDFVPFSSLRQLEIRFGFYLGDDILFRGNHCALEYLLIELGSQLEWVLTDYYVFSAGKYKNLEIGLVTIWSTTNMLVLQ